jgi:peptidoglycan/xylan/chitin deacetylase (PgdA/CDA1 family)
LSDRELRDELKDSKEAVEDHLARACSVLAYPYGGEDRRVRVAARRAGYDAAFGAPGNPLARDRFSVPRIVVVRKDGAGVRFNVKATHSAQAGRHALRKVSHWSSR